MIALSAVPASAATYFVKPTGDDTASGLSWAQAKRTINGALAGVTFADQVWVAAGIYNEQILMRISVKMYGGFAGTEATVAERNLRANATILDGGGAARVVSVANGAYWDTQLDGFVIRNGYATEGAGLYANNASPLIRNCVFIGNRSTGVGGGGAYFASSDARLIGCVFIENRANSNGGGIYATGSFMTVSNCVFFRNIANRRGGGVFSNTASLTLANNTIVENIAGLDGGGIGASGAGLAFHNSIVAFNSTGVTAANLTDARNNCVFGNPGGDYYLMPSRTGGSANISADPKFASVAAGDLHLQPGSPCIDAGDEDMAMDFTDFDDQSRYLGAEVDMGADESDGTTWPALGRVLYVSGTGDDSLSGLTWGDAKQTLAGAMTVARSGDEIWVAAGTYTTNVTLKSGVAVYGGFTGGETLRSQRNWRTNATVLDGATLTRVVTIQEGAGPSTVLDGVTLQNGKSDYGAGLYSRFSAPTVRRNKFLFNRATVSGGGLAMEYSAARVSLCTFRNNQASSGGAIHTRYSTASILGNAITSNSATLGGGVLIERTALKLINNTITDNMIGIGGGGLQTSYSDLLMVNNIIAFNTTGVYLEATTYDLRSNCVYGNGEGDYYRSDEEPVDPVGMNGNISVHPKFTNGGILGAPRLALDSPCIDAGDSSFVGDLTEDIDGEARVQDVTVDIGADEASIPRLHAVSLSPSSFVAGGSSTGTVTLTAVAPTGGIAVTLSASDTIVTIPATVTVPAGQTGVTFPVTTAHHDQNVTVTITAAYASVTKTTDVTLASSSPAIASFTPGIGCVGTEVTINGANFTGATSVTFNGTPATAFTVVSPTQIKALVPAGATTGKIGVITPLGTAASAADFSVVPWSARDVAQSLDGSTRMLMTNGVAVVINKWDGTTLQAGTLYTPANGWVPAALAADSAGGTFLLWKKGVGSYQVWQMNAGGNRTAALPIQTASGWTAMDIAAAGDGTARVMLSNSAGQVKVARIDGSSVTYGPTYTPAAGWAAVGIATGMDNKTRLLWKQGTASYQLWTLSESCALETAHPLRSTGGWTATEISHGGDGSTRVLLTSPSGQIRMHRLSGSTLQSGRIYTPAAGWSVVGISADPDGSGRTRLLWQHGNGTLNLWTFQSTCILQGASSMGTY